MVMVKGRPYILARFNGRHHTHTLRRGCNVSIISTFGRVYAAYGGVFIIMSLFWAYIVDKQSPDKYDVIGAIICIIGVLVMLLPSRA